MHSGTEYFWQCWWPAHSPWWCISFSSRISRQRSSKAFTNSPGGACINSLRIVLSFSFLLRTLRDMFGCSRSKASEIKSVQRMRKHSMSHLSHQDVKHSSLRLLCLTMKTGCLASSESPDEVIKNLSLWAVELLISQWVITPPKENVTWQCGVQPTSYAYFEDFKNLTSWTTFFKSSVSLGTLCVGRDLEKQPRVSREGFVALLGPQWHWLMPRLSE